MSYRNKLVRFALAALVIASVSSCGIFRKGCKCPSVHGHKVMPATQAVPVS